jgi:hypothetical protein
MRIYTYLSKFTAYFMYIYVCFIVFIAANADRELHQVTAAEAFSG